jgi:transposase-like protein
VREADACKQPGEVGALLRREGLYSSHLSEWRKQRDQGMLNTKRGRRPTTRPDAEVARLVRTRTPGGVGGARVSLRPYPNSMRGGWRGVLPDQPPTLPAHREPHRILAQVTVESVSANSKPDGIPRPWVTG